MHLPPACDDRHPSVFSMPLVSHAVPWPFGPEDPHISSQDNYLPYQYSEYLVISITNIANVLRVWLFLIFLHKNYDNEDKGWIHTPRNVR